MVEELSLMITSATHNKHHLYHSERCPDLGLLLYIWKWSHKHHDLGEMKSLKNDNICQFEIGVSSNWASVISWRSSGHTFSECRLELMIAVSWDNCIQLWFDVWWLLFDKLGFVCFLHQLSHQIFTEEGVYKNLL